MVGQNAAKMIESEVCQQGMKKKNLAQCELQSSKQKLLNQLVLFDAD